MKESLSCLQKFFIHNTAILFGTSIVALFFLHGRAPPPEARHPPALLLRVTAVEGGGAGGGDAVVSSRSGRYADGEGGAVGEGTILAAACGKHNKFGVEITLTGGAAKSIQSINVAAVVAVVVAAAVAGLASPAATHCMKKVRVWHKTVLFSLFFSFLEQPSFFPMSMPALNSFSGKGKPMKKYLFLKNHFFVGHFW